MTAFAPNQTQSLPKSEQDVLVFIERSDEYSWLLYCTVAVKPVGADTEALLAPPDS